MKNAKAWVLIQIATVLNVLVGVIAAHGLSSLEFGKFATVLAAVAIIVSILNPLINEISRVVSMYGYLSLKFITKLSVICSVIGICVSLICCLPIVENINQSVAIFILIPVLLVISSWFSGVLIGLNKLTQAGLLQIAGAVPKLVVLSIGFVVAADFIVAVWAYVVGFLATIYYGFKLTRNNYQTNNKPIKISYVVVAGFFLLALPFSLDQVLVQSLYPQISGGYAAIMTYSKIIMLASAPVLTIAYGSAIQLNPGKLKIFNLIKSVFKIALVTLLMVVIFWFVAPWCFPILLGSQYQLLIPNLKFGLISIGFHVISYLIFQTLVLSAKWWIIPILAVVPIVQIFGIYLYGQNNIDNLLNVSLFVFLIQLTVAFMASVFIANRHSELE